MHHEHHGNCCGHLEDMHQHDQQAVMQMAKMCCAGACNHAEHQQMAQFYDQQQSIAQIVAEEAEITKKETKKKAKKKRIGKLGVALAFNPT